MPSTSHVVSTLHGEELRRIPPVILFSPSDRAPRFSLSFVVRTTGLALIDQRNRPPSVRSSPAKHVPVLFPVKKCFASLFHPFRSFSLFFWRARCNEREQAFVVAFVVSRDPTEIFRSRGDSAVFKVSVFNHPSSLFCFFFHQLLSNLFGGRENCSERRSNTK